MTGRIIAEHRTNYVVLIDDVEYRAVVRGHFHEAAKADFPKVGDLVECERIADGQLVIEKILPRRSVIARKIVGGTEPQAMVANVDVMFIVMGLDKDFNLSRLERYLVLARQSAVAAVVILNKADLVPDPESFIAQVRGIAGDVPVCAVSAKAGIGMEVFEQYLKGDAIAVLLGSSGAGKSTITNWLTGDAKQATRTVRKDDSRGRHTTTGRHMFKLPRGGYLIDTPGMRELGVMGDEDDSSEVFADIEALRAKCEFSDCDHEKSAGCAIQAAIARGELDAKRLQNYLKMQREREYLASKVSEESAHGRKQRLRKLHTGYIKIQRQKGIERDET